MARPLVVTQVFFQGSILSTARTAYGEEAQEEEVQRLMQDQHKGALKQLRDGALDGPMEALLRDLPAEVDTVPALPPVVVVPVPAAVPRPVSAADLVSLGVVALELEDKTVPVHLGDVLPGVVPPPVADEELFSLAALQIEGEAALAGLTEVAPPPVAPLDLDISVDAPDAIDAVDPVEEVEQVLEMLAEPSGEDELPPQPEPPMEPLPPPRAGAIQSLRIPRPPSQRTPPQMAQVLGNWPPRDSGVIVVPSRVVLDGRPLSREPQAPLELAVEQTQAHGSRPPERRVTSLPIRPWGTRLPRLERPAVHARPTAEGVVMRPTVYQTTDLREPHYDGGDPPSRPTMPIEGELDSIDQMILDYLAEEVSGRRRK